MSKFYIVSYCYAPNTAATNRELSFVRSFGKLGIKCTLVFIMPSLQLDRYTEKYDGIDVIYLWKDCFARNKYLKHLYKPFSLSFFIKSINKEDRVLLLGCQQLITKMLKRTLLVYHERTEHPDVTPWPKGLTPYKYYESCKKLAGLFTISEPLRQHFVSMGCEPDKTHVINMTVDPSRFIGLSKQDGVEKYIAYCGTASNNKDGVDELIKSFALVSRRYPNYKLYIIGKTPSKEDEAGNLELIAQHGLQDKIVFTGIVSSYNMPQLLLNAEILALDRPDSLQAQCGFPTKLGEYLLTGNPVVVTKVGDIPKFLTDGKTALLSEERNSDDFSSKLIWAIEHSEGARGIGERGKEVALRNFNSDIEAKKMLNVIWGKEY